MLNDRFHGTSSGVVALMTPRNRDTALKQEISARIVEHRIPRSLRVKTLAFDAVIVAVNCNSGNAGGSAPQYTIGPVRVSARRFDEPHLRVELTPAV